MYRKAVSFLVTALVAVFLAVLIPHLAAVAGIYAFNRIDHTTAESTKTSPSFTIYTVKAGDRLVSIAKKHSVMPEEIIALNQIEDPARLQVGQVLKIPAKT